MQLENSGTDSILDLGLSKLEHRGKNLKIPYIENSCQIQSHFKHLKETRWKRVMKEIKRKERHFEFSKENFDSWKLGLKTICIEMIGGLTVTE
jgi:hypothetical protein